MTDDAEELIKAFERHRRVIAQIQREDYPYFPPQIFFSFFFLLDSITEVGLSRELDRESKFLRQQILTGLNNWYRQAQPHMPKIQARFEYRMRVLRHFLEIIQSGPLKDDTIFTPDDFTWSDKDDKDNGDN